MIIKLSKRQINEVRYIDAANRDMTSRMDRPYRKDWQEKYNQQPITNINAIHPTNFSRGMNCMLNK